MSDLILTPPSDDVEVSEPMNEPNDGEDPSIYESITTIIDNRQYTLSSIVTF